MCRFYFNYTRIICINESCYNYKINFYFDTNDGYLKFDQINKTWFSSNPENISETTLSGFWYFENISSLCLDYSDDAEVDGCYELIEFENTYFDCELNIQDCANNAVSFINIDEDENTCSQENYNTIIVDQQSLSNNINLDNFPFLFQNTLMSFKKSR